MGPAAFMTLLPWLLCHSKLTEPFFLNFLLSESNHRNGNRSSDRKRKKGKGLLKGQKDKPNVFSRVKHNKWCYTPILKHHIAIEKNELDLLFSSSDMSYIILIMFNVQ